MGTEIERKFLVRGDAWRSGATGVVYRQGYLSRERGRTVRIRIAGENAYLTIKGAVQGLSRPEFEYAIPVSDAEEMLALCVGPLIEKTRFRIPHAGHTWEVDEFAGENAGLIVAEVEMQTEHERVALPDWVGQEVTTDARYFNSNLATHPYRQWLPGRHD